MTDNRLDILQQEIAEPAAGYGSVCISRIRISNYRFFREAEDGLVLSNSKDPQKY
jgi:hypothetical protein